MPILWSSILVYKIMWFEDQALLLRVLFKALTFNKQMAVARSN